MFPVSPGTFAPPIVITATDEPVLLLSVALHGSRASSTRICLRDPLQAGRMCKVPAHVESFFLLDGMLIEPNSALDVATQQEDAKMFQGDSHGDDEDRPDLPVSCLSCQCCRPLTASQKKRLL